MPNLAMNFTSAITGFMSHFGVICPAIPGHLNPQTALARELMARGHRVSFYQQPYSQARLESTGFVCRTFATDEFPVERMAEQFRTLAKLSGRKALEYTIVTFKESTDVCLRYIPNLLTNDGVDALLVDQVSWAGATIAEKLKLPYVTFCNALVTNRESSVPPFCFTWQYRADLLGRLRNDLAYRFIAHLARPILQCLNDHRAGMGLAPIRRLMDLNSPYANVSQQPAEFEFPRRELPDTFHFVGPMRDSNSRPPISFPYEKLDGRPLVYASMGTLQNRQIEIFGKIAEACAPLPIQLIISLGGGGSPEDLGQLPGNPIVVGEAPQLDLLKRAKLCITHAGLNTTLECLAEGVPMVAIPITNDQPGVAARIVWTKTGVLIPLGKLTPDRLRAAVRKVLDDTSYSENASKMKSTIARYRGAAHAADIALAVAERRTGSH